jgi:cytochrome c553
VSFLKLGRENAMAFAIAFLFMGCACAADPNLCAACHGEGGNSANPAVPSLAGQPAQFISTSLYMFREGYRKDAQMSPMAAQLSNADLNELATYFSKQSAAPPRHRARPENAASGASLAQKFNCTQCHGPRLLGQQQIPRLAGQQFEYLRSQLRAFKAGKRGEMDGNMTAAAQALSDKDIEVLVDYIAGLGT